MGSSTERSHPVLPSDRRGDVAMSVSQGFNVMAPDGV
jgi:hypothetical protein